MGVVLWLLAAVLAAVSASTAQQVVYAGFDHLVVVDSSNIHASAFDYRRHRTKHSTCDLVAHPPLVDDAELQDWLSKGARKSGSTSALTFSYVGYEIILAENKVTGAWVARRCRDFRPQLHLLPCEVVATGTAELIKAPYKTIFVGNDRVMLLNTASSEYAIFPFDADVHSGGDPFKFKMGPLFMGVLPLGALEGASFAYVDLNDNYNDLLLVAHPASSTLMGYRFNTRARNENEWKLVEAIKTGIPAGFSVTSIGENQVMLYDETLNFRVLEFVFNSTRLVSHPIHTGNIKSGHNCQQDNATACVLTDGCAWCPSSKSCHNYDVFNNQYCDNHVCEEMAITEHEAAVKEDEPRECDQGEDEKVDEIRPEGPSTDLPGDIRLPTDYRDGTGNSSVSEASPVHPDLDPLLGDDDEDKDTGKKDDVVYEQNRASQGIVFKPPAPAAGQPCMDLQYGPDQAKLAEKFNQGVMNAADPLHPVKIYTASPVGESDKAVASNCLRKLTTDSTFKLDTNFRPSQGDSQPSSDSFIPASNSPRREEDTMNNDKTKYSLLKPKIVGLNEVEDNSLALKKIDSESLFSPKEPVAKPRDATTTSEPDSPFLLPPSSAEDMMNMGFHVVGLASDSFDNGGEDAKFTPTFNSAMVNSANPVPGMPKTIEQHLALFSNDPKFVFDPLPAPVPENTQTSLALPVASEPQQYYPSPEERLEMARLAAAAA